MDREWYWCNGGELNVLLVCDGGGAGVVGGELEI